MKTAHLFLSGDSGATAAAIAAAVNGPGCRLNAKFT
jgi:hypothetical protein